MNTEVFRYKLRFDFNGQRFRCSRKLDHHAHNSYPMHTHDHIELYYFVSGNCRCLVEGTEYKLQPKDILVIRPFEAHTMLWDGDQPYERIVFEVPMSCLTDADPDGRLTAILMNRPLGTNIRFTDADFGHTFCAECLENIDDSITHAGLLARSLLILTEALRTTQNRETELRPSNLGTQIIDYVNRKLFSPLTLEDVSREFFISRSQINRIFKENTGSSLWQYITAKRLLTARTRIRAGEPAMLVAAECGYADYSAFYRAYTKRFGTSPQSDKN